MIYKVYVHLFFGNKGLLSGTLLITQQFSLDSSITNLKKKYLPNCPSSSAHQKSFYPNINTSSRFNATVMFALNNICSDRVHNLRIVWCVILCNIDMFDQYHIIIIVTMLLDKGRHRSKTAGSISII